MTEHQKAGFLAFPMKVIISPLKAFREIAQNPDVRGLMLIAGLVLLATAVAQFARASKIFLTSDTQPMSLLVTSLFAGFLLSSMVQALFAFIMNWLVYAGVLFFLSKSLGQTESGPWRPFFIIVGHAFSVLVVYIAIEALLFSTLPEIHFQMSTWTSGTSEDIAAVNNHFNEVWGPTLAPLVENYFSLAFQFWLVMLGAVALHASRQIGWSRAIISSVVAYFITVFVTALLTGFLI